MRAPRLPTVERRRLGFPRSDASLSRLAVAENRRQEGSRLRGDVLREREECAPGCVPARVGGLY